MITYTDRPADKQGHVCLYTQVYKNDKYLCYLEL